MQVSTFPIVTATKSPGFSSFSNSVSSPAFSCSFFFSLFGHAFFLSPEFLQLICQHFLCLSFCLMLLPSLPTFPFPTCLSCAWELPVVCSRSFWRWPSWRLGGWGYLSILQDTSNRALGEERLAIAAKRTILAKNQNESFVLFSVSLV